MPVTVRTSVGGNMLEQIFISSERYAFDFAKGMRDKGWRQYDTNQDAWYYGIWYNPQTLQTLSYTEGDIYLISCGVWSYFKDEMMGMDEFHGSAAPPCAVAGSGIGSNMKLTPPITVIYDEEARLDYNVEQPKWHEPITIMEVAEIFLAGGG